MEEKEEEIKKMAEMFTEKVRAAIEEKLSKEKKVEKPSFFESLLKKKGEVEEEIKSEEIPKEEAVETVVEEKPKEEIGIEKIPSEKIKTGIPGFDVLIGEGIEKGSTVLITGGAGSGKTNFSSQFLYYGAMNGEKGLYITFEENPEQIKKHVAKFGMDFEKMEKEDIIRFVKVDVFQIAKAVEAALLKAKGELMIEMKDLPTIIPPDFKPERIVVDSLPALAAVFKKQNYRYFIFHLFSQLKESGATTFVISETGQEPTEYSRTGIEEFLADGVIVLYNIKHGDIRLRAIEILKMRGVKHEEKIVPFSITDRGIVVYPDQSILTVK